MWIGAAPVVAFTHVARVVAFEDGEETCGIDVGREVDEAGASALAAARSEAEAGREGGASLPVGGVGIGRARPRCGGVISEAAGHQR